MFLFLAASLYFSCPQDLWADSAKSEASWWSSAEARRLWEEPTAEIGLKSDSLGIHAACGVEDVKQ